MRRLNSSTLAGVLAITGAAFPIAVWYTYLFTANPSGVLLDKAALDQLKFSFSPEFPAPWAFALLAALPMLCLCIGFAYLAGFAKSRRRIFVLLVFATIAGVAAGALNDWLSVFLLAASAYYGWRHVNGG
jgi:hypothetical protein